jgi:hypothetical protein
VAQDQDAHQDGREEEMKDAKDTKEEGQQKRDEEKKRREEQEAADRLLDLDILQSELNYTIPLLMEFPKCYWIWNHRRWTLEESIRRLLPATARALWEAELALVGKMLTRDRRNFHAWGYRRELVARLESAELCGTSMVESEFEYTTRMIHVDLSNFSAWHNRSQLIPLVLDERGAGDAERKAFFEKGMSFVFPCLCLSCWRTLYFLSFYFFSFLSLSLSFFFFFFVAGIAPDGFSGFHFH